MFNLHESDNLSQYVASPNECENERTGGKSGGDSDLAVIEAYGDCSGEFSPEPLPTNSGNGGAYLPDVHIAGINEQHIKCGTLALVAHCSDPSCHKTVVKLVLCGKEWCEVCGQKDSKAHNRRKIKVTAKMRQVQHVGYLVVEFPVKYRKVGRVGPVNPDGEYDGDVRGWCYSKEDLQQTGRDITTILAGKRCGRRGRINTIYGRGYRRWHWSNDDAKTWNPHLNILVDADTLSDDVRLNTDKAVTDWAATLNNKKRSDKIKLWQLAKYQNKTTAWLPPPVVDYLKQTIRAGLGISDLIVHYTWASNPGQILNKVNYVTRPTFTNKAIDPYMASQLNGFRNGSSWGDWEQEPVWGSDLTESVEAKIESIAAYKCPTCGSDFEVVGNKVDGTPAYWSKPVQLAKIDMSEAEEIGETGYYVLPDKAFTGDRAPESLELVDISKALIKYVDLAALWRSREPEKLITVDWAYLLGQGSQN